MELAVTGYFHDLRIYKGVAKYKPSVRSYRLPSRPIFRFGHCYNRRNVFSNYSAVSGGTVADAEKAFNGSGNWHGIQARLLISDDPIHGVTKIEAAFDSPSGSGDTRGRYNGANGGATRTGTGSGYSDIYSGSAITVTSVGFALNQNGSTGTNNDIVSRFRITDSFPYILEWEAIHPVPTRPCLDQKRWFKSCLVRHYQRHQQAHGNHVRYW